MRKTAIVLMLAVSAASAASGPEPDPAVTLARYFAADRQPDWKAETVEIEASLPKLAERGRLRAIRRLMPIGRPEYQVLATEGGRTVRQQVIGRYLSADVEASAMSPASVAITLANYRFQYRGSMSDGHSLTYIYEINPRKKRAGLIRGQIWIDAATGLTVRQTGSLVRSPSMFVRSISLTRDTSLAEGRPSVRTTRVQIETRLVGRAELVITERPYTPEAGEDTAGVAQ